MSFKSALRPKLATIFLMLLMAATRFHHFGTPFSLPDASLAVFFLAGLWLGGAYLYISLLIEAVLIDYLAITQLGVSDFCVSNAYVFLIPTYTVMWLGGKWCGRFSSLTAASGAQQFAALSISASAAFLISNGSFYLLSGRYPDSSWGQYFQRFAMYYPPYLISTLMYVVVIFSLVCIAKSVLIGKNTQEAI